MTLPALLAACLCACLPTRAQLYIDVYPSQDNPNQTLWIFEPGWYIGGQRSATTVRGSSIRSSQNYHIRDSWKLQLSNPPGNTNFYTANKPLNQLISLSPLFSSTNNPKDIEAVTNRLPGGSRTVWPFGEPSFHSSVTNAPTITIGSTSRPIGKIFMNDADVDEIGIRVTPPNLVFTNGKTSRWFGTGIMNKPISDFSPLSVGAVGDYWRLSLRSLFCG